MTKEVKVGLGVIFSLTLVFGYVIYDRFFENDRNEPTAVASISVNDKASAQYSATATGISRPAEPARFTVVPAADWQEAAPSVATEPTEEPAKPAIRLKSPPRPTVIPMPTFRETEKPVLLPAEESDATQAAPESNGSVGAQQEYRPSPMPAAPIQQEERSEDRYSVAPVAAQGSGYQPPRVLPQQQQQSPAQDEYSPATQQAPVAQRRPVAQLPAPSQLPAREQQQGQADYAPVAQTTQPANQQSQQPYQPAARAVPTQYQQSRATAQRGPGISNRGTYQVRPNDTFWTISQKLYGTGDYFKALAMHNHVKHPSPDKLAVGDVVETPAKQDLMQRYPELCPKARGAAAGQYSGVSNVSAGGAKQGRVYEVQESDTLFDIARYELGDGSRWVEIYDLNSRQLTKDFDYLKPGMKILLPVRRGRSGTNGPASVARQPGSETRR